MKNKITLKHLREIWPNSGQVSDRLLTQIAEELSSSMKQGKIDTEYRLCHFLAQVSHEVGYKFSLKEDLTYNPSGLKSIFSYYRKNPEKAEEHGYSDGKKADQEAIANHAHAKRMGNGDISSGDGWKYIGRGLIQLTGKNNYIAFQKSHNDIWQESKNFVANPDLLLEPKYAVRSALIFWLNHKLYLKADNGISREVTDSITAIINRSTNSYAKRHTNLAKLINKQVFKGVFS